MFDSNIKSERDLYKKFPTEQSCIDYLEELYWAGTSVSPFKKNSKVYKCAGGKYKCKTSGKYFTVKTGTMFEGTKLELQVWFLAIWHTVTNKKGVTAPLLASIVGIHENSAWLMLQKIRANFKIENNNQLSGVVEADETMYGGKNKNRHKDKRAKNDKNYVFTDKVLIFGMLERGGKINMNVVPNRKGKTLQPIVRKHVTVGSRFITDEWMGYQGLKDKYDHQFICHKGRQYVNMENPDIHSNGIESSWKILKNNIRDTHSHVSKKHLQKYVDGVVFRFNLRQHPDSDKFNWLILNAKNRITLRELAYGDRNVIAA